jgi:hypothetical protein
MLSVILAARTQWPDAQIDAEKIQGSAKTQPSPKATATFRITLGFGRGCEFV